jgi:serine/threonine-protein kinase
MREERRCLQCGAGLAREWLRDDCSECLEKQQFPIALHPNRPLTDAFGRNSLYLNLTLLITLSASFKYRRQLGGSLDRRFFREAHDQERVLNELIERIAEIDSLGDISALVCEQLVATMHPHNIFVFYRETASSERRLRYRSGSGLEMGSALPDGFQILRMARETRKPIDLDRGELPTFEGEWLQNMGAHLVVPISVANQPPAGLLVMGEKRSEEPYGPADLKLLQGIAAQMAVVYERIWLREQVEVDRRLKYEVLAHVDAQSVDLLKECPACAVCYDNREQTCLRDGTQLIHTLPVSRTIESRYRLDLRIGQGGMGAVFEALDLLLRRKVAVKLLVGKLFGNLAALRRFEREAEACARLNHPNIIAIHDFGRIGQEGAYLVMDRLNGRTLRPELKRTGKLSPAAAVDWFDQFLNGLQAAHSAGIAHRDLKPENVFITPLETGDRITILDFGLAKLRLEEAAERESLTTFGTVMGTMGYMSPEQLSGQVTDTRSDLFSTCVIIFEAITGNLPFKAANYSDLLRAMSQDSPTIPGNSAEILRLNTLLRKCLAPDRSERFQAANELRTEMLPALRTWAHMT